MSQKFIIISIILILMVSFTTLAFVENRAADPNFNKDWWALYFQDPQGSSLDFTIENHSNATHFTYTISIDKDTVKQESIDIKKGETKNISTELNAQTDKKTIIAVSATENDHKEIYK